MLFITSLGCVINEVRNMRNINKNSKQIIAHAEVLVIIARSRRELEETFIIMEEKANAMGLIINESKTKYMYCNRIKEKKLSSLETGRYNFEKVNTFKYLGILINRTIEGIDIRQKMQQGYKYLKIGD